MGTDEILVWCTKCRHATPVPMAKLDHDTFCHCRHCQTYIDLSQPALVQRRLRARGMDVEPDDVRALRQYMTDDEIKQYFRQKREVERERNDELERKMYGNAL